MTVRAAAIFKALGHPLRIKVVDMLSSGDRCVCELFPALGVSQPNASQHLNVLRSAGAVDSYRVGTRIYYRLLLPELAALVRDCRSAMGEEQPEPYVTPSAPPSLDQAVGLE